MMAAATLRRGAALPTLVTRVRAYILPSCLLGALAASSLAADEANLGVIHRIKTEAVRHSQVMDHLFYLCDVYGARLTNSPAHLAAARWAVDRLKSFGVTTAKLEPWGTFGRGWSYDEASVQMKAPVETPLLGAPLAWSGGTDGPLLGDVVAAPFDPPEDASDLDALEKAIAAYGTANHGQLRGKIVLVRKSRDLGLPTKPASARLTTEELASSALAQDPEPIPHFDLPLLRLPKEKKDRRRILQNIPLETGVERWLLELRAKRRLHEILREEGVLATLTTDDRGDGGIVFAESAGGWEPDATPIRPTFVLIPEHYNRLMRLVEKKVPVRIEVRLSARFQDSSLDGQNVIGEIPGGKKKNELVMLGAHLDSWHTGTGATDNAAGCAVVLEAVRILKALDLELDRTVRVALWGGEEQGLFGSRGYVKAHFADPISRTLKPEHASFAGYFNLDNGTGKIRGIHLQENDMVRPTFEAWLAPFRDLGATTVTIQDTGGTDHLSFDAVGLPAFQFIQDPVDYGTRTHHSNLDVYDRAQPADLVQASMILASFVYHAACRETPLPRKPLPFGASPGGNAAASK